MYYDHITKIEDVKVRGFAGRKFTGRRVIDNRTPGMPAKGSVWPGLYVDPSNPPAEVVKTNALRAGQRR